MIVRKNLKFSIIIRGSWKILTYWLLLSGIVYALYFHFDVKAIDLPFGPVAVMGTALSIFLGFRNGSSYERWWDARKLWGGLVNNSRSFSRQVLTLGSAHNAVNLTAQEVFQMQKQLMYRHLAWINALRLQLRHQTAPPLWEEDVKKFLSEDDWNAISATKNRCTMLMLQQARQISDCQKMGIFDDYRHMQLDNMMNELYDLQGGCERIKNTPLPRQYDYFNKLFMQIFIFLLPFSLLSTFADTPLPVLIIPFTVLIGFVFYVVEGVGRRIEDPFENKITDTPMTALCRTIEIDLRQMLGEEKIPEKLEPVDGFLF